MAIVLSGLCVFNFAHNLNDPMPSRRITAWIMITAAGVGLAAAVTVVTIRFVADYRKSGE